MSEGNKDIENKLMNVLSDPTAMATIMNLVKSLGSAGARDRSHSTNENLPPVNESISTGSALESGIKTDADTGAVSAFAQMNQQGTDFKPPVQMADYSESIPTMARRDRTDEHTNRSLGLLLALKPFLSNERAQKLDMITQVMKVISIAEIFK